MTARSAGPCRTRRHIPGAESDVFIVTSLRCERLRGRLTAWTITLARLLASLRVQTVRLLVIDIATAQLSLRVQRLSLAKNSIVVQWLHLNELNPIVRIRMETNDWL